MLRYAIEKHGIEVFKKQILHIFDTEEEMNLKEEEIVDQEFVDREDTYNLCVGGKGGFGFINKNGLNVQIHRQNLDMKIISKQGIAALNVLRQDDAWSKAHGQAISCGLKNYYEKNDNAFKGKSHSEESLFKMRETFEKIGHSKGQKNSQFGTAWVRNDADSKPIKIKKVELEEYLKLGYRQGRK